MEQVVQELRRRGYRRIGLLESEMMEARTERSQSMAFRELLSGQATPSWKKAIQHNDRWTKQNYEQWLQVFRPDAVIASFAHIRDCLIETGVTIPKDLGFVSLSWREDLPDCTGIRQPYAELGAAAVDLVVAQIQRNERGLPRLAKALLLEGEWVEGRTLRPAPLNTATQS